ncbi:glycosyltransferase [Oculatella sp. FACHB-28]|uniref:glycosyltransferase n=1 Tax=Cyanophyceae TaxID=3028117 RepID=UPI001688EE36|nr:MULTISPECIES: glycosyltransferase [Cyanophyceae]MBD2055501.1 glycosyltransferase [Oculatella sp. FACHB-28]MBD2069867.1 glycosyltransferase [Leptolyngbya sp. FACHB-671]
MKQSKVSLVVSDLSQSGAGRWGGAVRTFLLAQALQKLGYEVEIVGFVFGDVSDTVVSTEFSITTVCGKNYPGFVTSMEQVLSKISGDIVYAIKPKPTSFGTALLKKLRSRCPVILDIDDWELSWYGGEQWRYRPQPKQFFRDILKSDGALRQPDHPLYLKWIENFVNYADAVTIHTQFLQKRFGGTYVPNGKDTSLFDPQQHNPENSRIRLNLADYRVLMFPGAPRPYKGLEDVLMALDYLNEPDLRLVIVGGSPYDDYDDKLIQKWGRWIIKLPKIPHQAMPEVIAAAHVVVVPQRDTPAAQAQFPLKLTDGMAMAKPVLATRVGDIAEILGGTGYLVEPDSPKQIAEQIQYIFQNMEEANNRGHQARARCVEHYSIDSMSTILSDVIKSIA